jgi:hypothetical protein
LNTKNIKLGTMIIVNRHDDESSVVAGDGRTVSGLVGTVIEKEACSCGCGRAVLVHIQPVALSEPAFWVSPHAISLHRNQRILCMFNEV